MTDLELTAGDIAWASLVPVCGREQGGHRPVLIIASSGYLQAVTSLVIALPVTAVDRGWPNHVSIDGPSGLSRPSWVMTEQLRTVSRGRLTGIAGRVSPRCLDTVRTWIGDFLDL